MRDLSRKAQGHTLIELIVIIGMLAAVTALLYGYYNQGWRFFNKSFSFGLLQRNARVTLEDLADRLRHASRDYIYTDTSYSPGVPFPVDALYDKPYIYFAVPNISFEIDDSREKASKEAAKAREARSNPVTSLWREIKPIVINPLKKEKTAAEQKSEQGLLSASTKYSTVTSYDYYLCYFSAAKSDPETGPDQRFTKSARLRLLRYRNQSTEYTESPGRAWPFLPPELAEEDIPDDKKISKQSYIGLVQREDLGPEFSIYKSTVVFDYSGDNYDKLFLIRVNLYDEQSSTRVSFQTAVAPRN